MEVIYKAPEKQAGAESRVDGTVPNAVPLSNVVKQRVMSLLEKDSPNPNLHEVIIGEMDDGIIAALIKHTNNNQSEATRILGLARGTVRKKWSHYTRSKQEENKW